MTRSILNLYKLFLILTVLISLLSSTTVYAQDETPLPVYIVQPGDTLSAIAVLLGVSVTDLIQANDLPDPNAIAAGTSLRIPGLPGIQGTLVTETIPYGSSLRTLSISNRINSDAIVRLNRITSPSEVFAGSVLVVPKSETKNPLFPTATVEEKPLLEIAIEKNANPWTIILANDLQGSWDVSDHQVLFSPDAAQDKYSPISPWIENIEIKPLPLVQGKTTVVVVKAVDDITLSGSIGEQTLHFYGNGSGEYVAFAGIGALEKPGLYPVTIHGETTTGKLFDYTQPVILAAGGYTQEYVVGVDSSTIDPEIIQQEDDVLSQINQTEPHKLWTASFNYPVDEPCLNSRFGNRRSYNNGQYQYYHTGVDFKVCADNLNIYSPAPGIVRYAGNLPVKGNFTLIDHGWGIYSGYAHQSEILVNAGDAVDTGQLIGIIGDTGRSVGPHLHWEIWINGIPVNPVDWAENSFP